MDRDYPLLLSQVLSKLFPETSMQEQAMSILSSYGREGFHREVERVHLGILRVSGDDLTAVAKWTQFACRDFRDLLIEAEYRLSFGKDRLRAENPKKYEALKKKEREQYDAWIAQVLAPNLALHLTGPPQSSA